MIRSRILASLVAPLLITAVIPLYAVKEVEMPDNFGSAEWALNNWSESVNYLRYIARDDIRGEFEQRAADERLEAWESFWAAVDKQNGTLEQESRAQYFQRIRYANENFGSILLPGWKTEMGETWIRLGPPDWRDRYAMRGAGRNLEVWNYMDSRDTYLVFMDRTGVGDYDLLNYGAMIEEVYFY